MKFKVNPSVINGTTRIPGSKSHTVRAVFFGALADGDSIIEQPLESEDTKSAFRICRALGAEIEKETGCWKIKGFGGKPSLPAEILDVANSGTTMRIALGTAALCREGEIILTGDEQIRRRPVGQLVSALRNLGAQIEFMETEGCPPVKISSPMRGGKTTLKSPTSQFLTSLLINCPLAQSQTEIDVLELNEKPYIEMTLWWLEKLGIKVERKGLDWFRIPGGQKYKAFTQRIPGDFSSAAFFAVAAAVTGGNIFLEGLDPTDVQGDKAILDYIREMGAYIRFCDEGISVAGGPLEGGEFDLNATPDALPAMAVAACFAEGETRLVNVPQARIKETDRIAVMAKELSKMGADIKELKDGLVIRRSRLKGAEVEGHSDHRVVMALCVAGLAAEGSTTITTAESAAITFPTFYKLMKSAGAVIEEID